jgi:hypothetical protein
VYRVLTRSCALGFDARFPNVNQTKHCWQNYVDYHKCIIAKGEDFAPCRQVRISDAGGRLVLIARSSCWLTDPSAPAAGPRDGTTSAVRGFLGHAWRRPLAILSPG